MHFMALIFSVLLRIDAAEQIVDWQVMSAMWRHSNVHSQNLLQGDNKFFSIHWGLVVPYWVEIMASLFPCQVDRLPVNFHLKGPVSHKKFPFDNVTKYLLTGLWPLIHVIILSAWWQQMFWNLGPVSISEKTSRSLEVSKPRDWYFELSYRFEIWQTHRQHCCRSVCQISERSDNSKYKSRGFETLRDPTERRLFGYWDGALPLSYRRHWK